MYIMLIAALWGSQPTFEQVNLPSQESCLMAKQELEDRVEDTNINSKYLVVQCIKG